MLLVLLTSHSSRISSILQARAVFGQGGRSSKVAKRVCEESYESTKRRNAMVLLRLSLKSPGTVLWWIFLSQLHLVEGETKNLRGDTRDFNKCGVIGSPVNGRRTKIVHGRNAVRCAYRWQVSIQSTIQDRPWHFCGGTLITPQWVLTAAHCAAEVTNVCQLKKLRVLSGAEMPTWVDSSCSYTS